MPDGNSWPPEQPAGFIPLLLIHYQGYRIPEQVSAMAKLMHRGEICKLHNHHKLQKFMDISKTKKEIEDIFTSLKTR